LAQAFQTAQATQTILDIRFSLRWDMFGVRTLALALLCCTLAPSEGLRKRRRTGTSEASGINCDLLSNIRAGEKNFQNLTKWVCAAWPPSFGSFPIDTTNKIVDLLELAFGKGGIWEDMKQIWGMRRNRRFCWRNETLREVIPPESNLNCKMESNGTCYGNCPRGYKPGALQGRFQPVCTTVCADTFHQIPCGFGCANTRLGCLQTILDQVGTVAKEVGKAIGFVTGNPAVAPLVDKVVTIVEFFIEVLPKILIAVKNVYKYVSKGQKEVAFFLLLFQFASEVYPDGYSSEEMQKLRDNLQPVMEYVLEIVDGDLGNIIDLGVVRDTIINHGDQILDSIKIITKAFDYPKCGEMERATVFTIEDTGDDDMVGPWVQYYEVNQRPRYVLATDNKWLIEYSSGKKSWRLMSPPDWLSRRKIMYTNPVELSDYPLQGWVSQDGPLPVPVLLPAKFTCNALEQLSVNGRGFGSIAGAICHFWPESLGPWPLNNEQKAFDILESAFGDGGLWDQIEDIKNSRRETPDFCWRKEAVRPVLASGSGCKLVSEGVCYGECPWGYRKGLLVGRFAPVCSSACGESEKSFPCGFGCSNGLGSCLDNIRDQVGELTRFMGTVAGFAFNNSVISDVVERITYVAEFFLQVLPVLVKKAKDFWSDVKQEEAEVALLVVLLQYIYEQGAGGDDFEVLRDNIGEVTEFTQSLVRANFQFADINLDFIKDLLASTSDKLLTAMVSVTEGFLYKRCNPADSIVNFAIDEAGEEKVLGLWIEKGTSNGRPRYELRTDGSMFLEWRESSWQVRAPHLLLLKKTLYQASVDSPTPPAEGWEVVKGADPPPTVILLKQ
jgi:hypothetical protein